MNNGANPLLSGSNVAMLAGWFMLVVAFALILEQIGAPQLVISLWLLSFAVGTYLFSGLFGKTMRFSTFQSSDKDVRPVFGGMAIAAAVLSGNVLILLPGDFYTTGTAFLATYSGILIGLALSIVLFSAAFSRSKKTSIASVLYPEGSNRILLLITALIIIVCSLCLLAAQLKLLDLFFKSFFGFGGQLAVILTIITVVFCLFFGGMQALGVARVLGFSAMAIAFFVPLIWISYRATGNPLPQFSFGYGALQPIAEIDREMIEAGFANRGDVFSTTTQTTQSGYLNGVLSTLALGFGIAALPHVLQHYFTITKGSAARHSGMWGFWLTVVFLSAIPALALFAKLNIYTSVLGLQISELATETPWLFNLSANGSAPLLLICGQLVGSTADVLQACGSVGEAFIGIQDIGVNPDYLLVGLGFLAELPPLLTTLLIAAAFFCILTTVDGLLFVTANTVTVDIYNRIFRPRSPAGIKLFMSRFFLITVAGLILLFYPGITARSQTLFVTAMVLGCATLFPMLIARTWIVGLADIELGLAMFSALVTSCVLLVMVYAGQDLQANTGDEWPLNFGIFETPFDPLVIGISGLFTFVITTLLIRVSRQYIPMFRRTEDADASA